MNTTDILTRLMQKKQERAKLNAQIYELESQFYLSLLNERTQNIVDAEPDGDIPYDVLPPTRPQPRPSNGQSETPPGYVDFYAEVLDVGIDQGKKVYKVKGGGFKKWGVRIWDEVLEREFKFILADLAPGMYDFKYHVRAELHEGKPRKVIGHAP